MEPPPHVGEDEVGEHALYATDAFSLQAAAPLHAGASEALLPDHIDFSSPEIWALLGFPAVPEDPPVTVAEFPPMPPTPLSHVYVPVEAVQDVRLVGLPGAELAYLPGLPMAFSDPDGPPVVLHVEEVAATEQAFTYVVRTAEQRTVRAFKCRYCDAVFLKKAHVLRHQHADHERRLHACPHPDCHKRFETEQLLKSHFRTHRTPEELNTPFPCPELACFLRFATREELVTHLRERHPQRQTQRAAQRSEKRVSCPHCHVTVLGEHNLTIHMRTHSSERPHACPYADCHKAFRYKGDLNNHIRTHTGERPFKCHVPGCGKAFADHSTLRGHIMAHSGYRPYRCPTCARSFGQSSKLKRHMRTNHQVFDFKPVPSLPPPDPAALTLASSLPHEVTPEQVPQETASTDAPRKDTALEGDAAAPDEEPGKEARPKRGRKKAPPRGKRSKSEGAGEEELIDVERTDDRNDAADKDLRVEESAKGSNEKESDKEKDDEKDKDSDAASVRRSARKGKRRVSDDFDFDFV